MGLKYIILPEAVSIGNARYSLKRCVEYIVDNDVRYAQPASHVRAGARVLKAFETDKTYVELKEEDWNLLNDAFEKPSAGWGSWMNEVKDENGKVIAAEPAKIAPRVYLPLINAVSEAVNTEPEAPKVLAPPEPAPLVCAESEAS